MSNDEFGYEQVVECFTKIASEKDPQKLGSYIYYVMKQYPDCPFMLEYSKNVNKTAEMVAECFGWNKRMVSELKAYIDELTKYIKKSG